MTDFVTYNGNQYDPAKLNQSKGGGAKASIVLDQLYNYFEAPESSVVTTIIVTPFQDGFSVIVKPDGDQVFPADVHIVSKMILKKIKHDPNAKYVETNSQSERPAFRQERPQNSWNNRPGSFPRTKPQSSPTARPYVSARGLNSSIALTQIDKPSFQPNRTPRPQTPR